MGAAAFPIFHTSSWSDCRDNFTVYLHEYRRRHCSVSEMISYGLMTGIRFSFRAGPPCLIHFSPKVWFRCFLSMRRKWNDVPSCMNHLCCSWWRCKSSKIAGESFTKRQWYTPFFVCWVRQLVLRTDHLKCLPRYWMWLNLQWWIISSNYTTLLKTVLTAINFVTIITFTCNYE
jgi:hypothetical protein